MSSSKPLLGVALVLALGVAPVLVGCESAEPQSSDFRCAGGRCDAFGPDDFQSRWALDMRKVRADGTYQDGITFLGARPQELGLDMTKVPAELRPVICERSSVIGRGGSVSEGQCALWGNMMRLNYDHSVHVDAPGQHPVVNVIDESGAHLDPPGYLNIIAMYDTCEDEQQEIVGTLRNGDILVYFHPEDSDTTQFRMHHAAMYYETNEGPLAVSLDGPSYVHHIDNPESYGPAFTGGTSSTPFHVFRLDVRNVARSLGGGRYSFTSPTGAEIVLTDEMADMYGYAARNWAFLTNDHAPFADFHYMSWNDAGRRQGAGLSVLDEVDRFARPTLERGETPEVYCAGLVYTNLNLAINRPMNRTALGSLWSAFDGQTFQVDDGYFSADLTSSALASGVESLPGLGRLVFEPVLASDLLDMWLEGYVRAPLDPTTGQPVPQVEAALRQVRAQILGGGAETISEGFSSLVWAATKDPAGRDEASVVASPDRIRTYATVYAQALGADNLTVAVGTTARGLDLVVTPGADGQADVQQVKDLERRYVENRYVPPPLYFVMANRPDSMISYVGTVIPVSLLTRIDPSQPGVDIPTGEIPSNVCNRYRQGGPDSSLYEHYAVPDGGRHVQRIFEISSGPYELGEGTQVVTRLSAADVRDVRILLHPPATFAPLGDRYACERNPDCIGDAPGILLPLDPSMNGGQTVWNDVTVTFDLLSPTVGCTQASDGKVLCPLYSRATDAPGTGESAMVDISQTYGEWTISVSDRGAYHDAAEVPHCVECPRGGAHTNQWVLVIHGTGSSYDGGGDGEDVDNLEAEQCGGCTAQCIDCRTADGADPAACETQFASCIDDLGFTAEFCPLPTAEQAVACRVCQNALSECSVREGSDVDACLAEFTRCVGAVELDEQACQGAVG